MRHRASTMEPGPPCCPVGREPKKTVKGPGSPGTLSGAITTPNGRLATTQGIAHLDLPSSLSNHTAEMAALTIRLHGRVNPSGGRRESVTRNLETELLVQDVPGVSIEGFAGRLLGPASSNAGAQHGLDRPRYRR